MLYFIILLFLTFQYVVGDECVKAITRFQDPVMADCVLILDYKFISYGNWMAYTFEKNPTSKNTTCGFVDICLNVDYGANILEGECGGVNEEETFTFEVANCDTQEVFTTFTIDFKDSTITASNITNFSGCDDVCHLKISNPTPNPSGSSKVYRPLPKELSNSKETIFDPKLQIFMEDNDATYHTMSTENFIRVCPYFNDTPPDSSTVAPPFSSSISPTVDNSPKLTPITPVVPPALPDKPDAATCKNNTVIGIYCNITESDSTPEDAHQVINETLSFINKMLNISHTETYYIGAIIYKITKQAIELDPVTVNNTLEIINKIASQTINVLKKSNQNSSLLWYSCTITNLVGKSKEPISYQSKSSPIFVQSWNNTADCMDYIKTPRCFNDEGSQKFCIAPTNEYMCHAKLANPYVMITPVQFYILGDNVDGTAPIQFEIDSTNNDTKIITVNNSDNCNCGNVLPGNGAGNFGWVYKNGTTISVELNIAFHHSKSINDLHRKPYVAIFDETYFVAGPEMSRTQGLYEVICSSSQCTLYLNGCSNDFLQCHVWLTLILALALPLGMMFVLFLSVNYFYKHRNAPPPKWLAFILLISDNFRNRDIQLKARWFSLTYNIMFTFFACLIFVGNNNYLDDNTFCYIIAGISHFTYLVCVMLSINNIFISSQAFNNWKNWYGSLLWVIVGSKTTKAWPLVFVFCIPLAITGTFALTMPEFLQANDGSCWIRSDYKIEALWVPMIMIICSMLFYIPLMARCWPDKPLMRHINKLFVEDSGILQSLDGSRSNSESEQKDSFSPTYICFRLFVPQILIGLPVIANAFALHVTHLNFGSILFVVAIGLHILQTTLGEIDECERSTTRRRSRPSNIYPAEERVMPGAHIETSQRSFLHQDPSTIPFPDEGNSEQYRYQWYAEQNGVGNQETNHDNDVPSDWDESEDEDNRILSIENRRPVPLRDALMNNALFTQRYQNSDEVYRQQAVNNRQVPRTSTSSYQSTQQSDARMKPKRDDLSSHKF